MEALLYFCAFTRSEDKAKPSKIAPNGEESLKRNCRIWIWIWIVFEEDQILQRPT